MASEYKQKSSLPHKQAVRRKALPDHEADSASIQPTRQGSIQRLQSLVGNHQTQRMIAGQSIQRGILDDALGAVVKVFNAMTQEATAKDLWIGEGNTAADWDKATDVEKKPYQDRAKIHIETAKKMEETDGYKALTPDEKDKLLKLVEGTNRELSVPANNAMKTLLDTAKPEDLKKPDPFREFITTQAWLPGVVAPTAKTFDGKTAAYKITGPDEVKDYAYTSKKADAQKYEVEVGKKKVPVYRPKTPDATVGAFHTVDEVAIGLATLPEVEFGAVTKVNIEPDVNPKDAEWAIEYNTANFRSYMTAGVAGVVTIYPTKSKMTQSYLQGTMIHETGHSLSLKKWGQDAKKDAGWQPWRDAMKKDGILPSGYAKNSPSEDFAEALQLLEQVHGKPQEAEIEGIMPERVKLIRKLLSGK
jgi:hypothetical protein